MGAITNEKEDAAQLAVVHAMPLDGRRWIQHHFGNALAGAISMLHLGRYDEAMAALDHAVADLRQITPPEERMELARINLRMMEMRGKH